MMLQHKTVTRPADAEHDRVHEGRGFRVFAAPRNIPFPALVWSVLTLSVRQ